VVSTRVFAEPPTISKLFVQLHQLDNIVAVHCQFIFAARVGICIGLGALSFKLAEGRRNARRFARAVSTYGQPRDNRQHEHFAVVAVAPAPRRPFLQSLGRNSSGRAGIEEASSERGD
jgi:hypothetical protein